MIELNRIDGPPLGEQVADGLAALMARGELLVGARLPSVRQLAQRLGISVFTVMAGYDRLAARNLVVARPGAGYFVAGAAPAAPLPLVPVPVAASTLADPVDAVGFALQMLDGSGVQVKSGSGFLPPEWLDDAVPAALVARVVKARSALLEPVAAQGHPGLRAALVERLRTHGISASAAQVVTTVGATHAIDLLMRALLRPGDTVLVEDPGYLFFATQARALDLQLVAIERRADGPDLEALEAAAGTHRPRMLIMQTLVHNPTGGSTSAVNCHRLLKLAERYDFQILEDDVYGDLAAPGATRLAQLDGLERVTYVSSFSKLLSPGLRLGFMALPARSLDAVLGQKVLNVMSCAGFTEAILEQVLRTGRYQRHTQQLRARLARAREPAAALLRAAGVSLDSGAAEGVFLWGRLPGLEDPDALVRSALEQGVLLAKGRMFSPTGRYHDHLRFNVVHSGDPRLAQVLHGAGHAAGNDLGVRAARVMRLRPSAGG